ncbi:hypothetical protein SJ322_24995 [Serratia marcescens]|uniref:hypothetical protein n=1 Tax=Serratia marcescens TaxID=615 RepID=UPI0029D4B46C|nr:hypothetical protein [Serratia marcescens]MDX7275503.1 hypothetical protein [Serratia marcescens]
MDNKLSELSKPVGYYRLSEDGVSYYLSSPTEKLDEEVVPLYSQEYVSALLAELEVKDKHIAELENESLVHRHRAYAAENKVTELQAKLATPVRLPSEHELRQVACSECAGNCLELVEGTVRAAGFTVEGDDA